MTSFTRTDKSLLNEWWQTIDRRLFLGLIGLILVGAVMSFAAGPAAAERIGRGLSTYHFVERHFLFLVPAVGGMIAISMLSVDRLRLFAVALFVAAVAGLIATQLWGMPVKGAQRWISVGSFTLQVSEFAKPAMVMVAAILLSETARTGLVRFRVMAIAALALMISLIVTQPDFGQSVLMTMVFGAQVFMSGLSFALIGVMGAVMIVAVVIAYYSLDHVASRIDRFMNASAGDTGQMDRARQALESGGFFGRGPGEGVVKNHLPEAQGDYVFAVVGEEFGALACLVVIGLFAFITLRSMSRVFEEQDHFVQLSAGGLALMFGLQAIINIGVNVNLLPSKGMTLPFISYGGSSTLALAISVGLLLALTRKRITPVARPSGRLFPRKQASPRVRVVSASSIMQTGRGAQS